MMGPMKLLDPAVIIALAACGSGNNDAAEPQPASDQDTAVRAGPPAPADPAEPGEVDPEWKRMGDLAVGLMRKLHAVATTNAGNCESMADGLVAMADENKSFIEETKRYQVNGEFNAWFARTYQDELGRLLKEIGPAMMGCKDNPKFNAALQKFQS